MARQLPFPDTKAMPLRALLYRRPTEPQAIEVFFDKAIYLVRLRRHRQARRYTLRIQAATPFRLRWTADEWSVVNDTTSTPTALGIEFVDIPIVLLQAAPIRFTFFWPAEERWEGRDFAIAVKKPTGQGGSMVSLKDWSKRNDHLAFSAGDTGPLMREIST